MCASICEGVFHLNKKYLVLPLSTVMALGLAGCGNNDEAANQNRYNDTAQPMGYYSNENHKGNARILNDNDGPVTEMMDHNMGNERNTNNNLQVRNGNTENNLQTRDGNLDNPTRPLANTDRNMFQRDNRFSRADTNYHGHLNSDTKKARSSYYTDYDGEFTEQIGKVASQVPNVKDARSVTHGKKVIVAVDLNDSSKEEATKRNVEAAVKPLLKGRSVTVVTDDGTFGRIRSIDNDLRNGGPKDGINMDLENMFQTITNRVTNDRR
jgi:spore cortex protein